MADSQVGSETENINDVPHIVHKKPGNKNIIGQLHPGIYPRYSGIATFCRLPILASMQKKTDCDIAVIGIPWDAGTSYRSGARFGPSAIREASRLYRPYNIQLETSTFKHIQICDAGDAPCSPYIIEKAVDEIYNFCTNIISNINPNSKCIAIMGGDHTLSYPVIKSVVNNINSGNPIALIHFDAHLDTYPPVYGADIWHGSPFRKCFEDNLIDINHSIHVGVRNSIWDKSDFSESESMGFECILCNDVHERGVEWTVRKILERVGYDTQVYVSIDIDVIDVCQAPGTGTPEIAGLFTYQLLAILNGLRNLNVLSCDVVEVSPVYDTPNSQITSLAATGLLYQMITIMGNNILKKRKAKSVKSKL